MKLTAYLIGTIFFIFSLFAYFINNKSLKIYENDKLVAEITQFPKTDTSIMVKNYFIKYKAGFIYLEGTVDNSFNQSNGSFQSFRNVNLYFVGEEIRIESSFF